MNRVLRFVLILSLVSAAVMGKPHAYGPWNIEAEGTANLETSSNSLYEEGGSSSDFIFHLIPRIKFEYEKYRKILFSAELELDSNIHTKNREGNITEIFLRIEAKPQSYRRYGGYFLFSDEYQKYQTYSGSQGLLTGNLNNLMVGGGYKGGHLDFQGTAEMRRGFFSPSDFNFLDFTQNGFNGTLKYRINSLYWLSGIELGRISYTSNLMNDGAFFSLNGGVGKEFSRKTSLEFKMKIYSQNHEGKGDDFRGLLFGLNGKHETFSGKTVINGTIEKTLLPSTALGAEFLESTILRFTSKTKFTHTFEGEFDVALDFNSVGNRRDRGFNLGFNGQYTFQKGLNMNFGITIQSVSSTDDEFSYRVFRLMYGISAIY